MKTPNRRLSIPGPPPTVYPDGLTFPIKNGRVTFRRVVGEAAVGIMVPPAVVFAEPNWIHEHRSVSKDPYYQSGQLWGMYGNPTSPANAFGSEAGEAWAAGNVCSSSVYVASSTKES